MAKLALNLQSCDKVYERGRRKDKEMGRDVKPGTGVKEGEGRGTERCEQRMTMVWEVGAKDLN